MTYIFCKRKVIVNLCLFSFFYTKFNELEGESCKQLKFLKYTGSKLLGKVIQHLDFGRSRNFIVICVWKYVKMGVYEWKLMAVLTDDWRIHFLFKENHLLKPAVLKAKFLKLAIGSYLFIYFLKIIFISYVWIH